MNIKELAEQAGLIKILKGFRLSPYYYQCNLRIDWGMDGGIYKVEFQNMEKNGGSI